MLGAQIVTQNTLYPKRTRVNLVSALIGNGYISPLDGAYGYWETLCTTNPGVDKPIFNETRCDFMAANLPRCMDLGRVCYLHPDPAICAAASQVCWDGVVSLYDSEAVNGGRNRFDITAPCDIDDICYQEALDAEEYLNTPAVFKALGVPKAISHYNMSSMLVEQAFETTNDIGIWTQPQVIALLAAGVDILIYQGKLDLACNTAGNLRWASNMAWKGQPLFNSKQLEPWMSGDKRAGEFKEVQIQMQSEGPPTRFTFLTVEGAGHMVCPPHDILMIPVTY